MKSLKTIFKKTIRLAVGWSILLFLWWILAEDSGRPIVLLIGVLGSGGVIFLYHRFDLSIDIPMSSLALPVLWIKFFLILISEIGKTTIRTCYLIITGKFEPKIIAYETELETGYGLLFLLNSITLTPTTIAVLSEKNLIYIHHLQLEDKEDYEETTRKINSNFENPLKELIG